MITLTFKPSGLCSTLAPGTSLFEAILQAGLPLGSSCDGDALCGWCRVQVIDGHSNLSPIGEEEAALLTKREAEPHERIACLALAYGPAVITTTYW